MTHFEFELTDTRTPGPHYTIKGIDDAWIAKAKALGIEVRVPKPNELFLDLDTQKAWAKLVPLLSAVTERTGIVLKITEEWFSSSGWPHRHVIVEANTEITQEFRAFLQMYMGSDPNRELRSYADIHDGAKYPTVFIEGPWKTTEGLEYPGTQLN